MPEEQHSRRVIDLADAPLSNKEKELIKKRMISGEQVPSTRQQSLSYQFFQEQIRTLGNPYDVTRIPISVCEQMQRDPMIAFGLHFINVPLMRSRWYIKCERADIAAFIDNALRPILPRYIQQRSQAMSFGFAPIVKRFQLEQPKWTYIDPAKSDKEIKVWNNGNVDALTWKPFTILPSNPNITEPLWDERNGEFNGIKYHAGGLPTPFAAIDFGEGAMKIDVNHALWITNERETVNGSVWGFPRIGYAYRYWWSYWFRWALYDRFFERKSDPPYEVYYPVGGQGDYTDEETPRSMKEIALGIGEQARAGGVVALPGQTVPGYDDRPTTVREWQIKEIEVSGDMTHFVDSFDYLDVMKLRSLWIPEQALIEGSGGTSSRNVASEEISLHKEASGALADEIDEELNRWVIPDLVRANFPEFDGEVRKVTTGFTEADQQTMQQAFQWISQTDPTAARDIDKRELANRLGLPTISLAEIRRQEKEAEKALQDTAPPVVDPKAAQQAGVDNQGFYVQPREKIDLSSISLAEDKFLASLPRTKHYSDKAVLQNANHLKAQWKDFYKSVYDEFASHLSKVGLDDLIFIETLELDAKLVPNKPGVSNWVEKHGGLPKKIADMAGDLITERGMDVSHAIAIAVSRAKLLCAKGKAEWCKAIAQWEKMRAAARGNHTELSLADEAEAKRIAKRIAENWNFERNKLETILSESSKSLRNVISRAGTLELRQAGFSPEWKTDTDSITAYLSERGAEFIKAIDETVRHELQTFLVDAIQSDKTQDEIIAGVREHFADFPDWKANRLVRSEIRNAYNFGTLAAGEQAGIKKVQARDAQFGNTDETCIERNGKIFDISDAFSETEKEHPNGTLEWVLLNRENLSTKYVEDMPDGSDSLIYFDDESGTVYIKNDTPRELEQKYLIQLGEMLTNV